MPWLAQVAVDTAILSALIGAVSALLVTVLAPLLDAWIARRRARHAKREEILGRLKGIARAFPQLLVLQNGARLNVLAQRRIREIATDDDARRRAAEMEDYFLDFGNGLLRDLTALDREVEELVAAIRIHFPDTPDIRQALEGIAERTFKVEGEPPADPTDVAAIRAWRDSTGAAMRGQVTRQVREPFGTLLRVLEAQAGRPAAPAAGQA